MSIPNLKESTCTVCGAPIYVRMVKSVRLCAGCSHARRLELERAGRARRRAEGRKEKSYTGKGNGGERGRPVGGTYVTNTVRLPTGPRAAAPHEVKGRPGVAAHAPSYMAPGSPEAAEAVERAKYLLQLGTDAGNPRKRRTIAHLVMPREEFPWLGRGGI